MLRITMTLIAVLLFSTTGWAKTPLKTESQKISYLLGLQFGSNLVRQGIKLDLAAMTAGLQDGRGGAKPRISQKDAAKIMNGFRATLMAKMKAEQSKAVAINLKAGAAFLKKNKKSPGVKVTKSGLQYKILKKGRGRKPTAKDTVRVHYEGRLINGHVFDSSIKRGQPAEFPINGVIPGWTEALQLMKVGSKWQLAIPAALAYGERGMSNSIPPNSVLLFDVELLAVKK